ncbi:glycolate oxidase subunit GlcE [Pseudomonas panipatensis]|uniref:glycolate oxidase subunit GlcE n=1 Tax=Pseudomonas panipatensis TaxID=428992 RepID=UPI0035B432E7
MENPHFDPSAGHDRSAELLEQVRQALAEKTPLAIRGGSSKAFLGRWVEARPLDLSGHTGIVSYDPTELVITARAGTPLRELNAALDSAGQMLACEAPSFGDSASVGGMLAAGLSGPRRPWAGAVRDFVLGTRLISGLGTHLRFGGEVMKNVAGYDLSRLLAGSFGCLGVITEASFKVLPKPRCRISLRQAIPVERALLRLGEWGQQPLPLSAAAHDGEHLYLRFEGNEGSVRAACERIGGDALDDAWWDDLREQRLAFFGTPQPLWRLSLPALSAPLALPGTQLLDWGGAQRWLKSDAPAAQIRQAVSALGGHATCFTPGHVDDPLHPLPAPLLKLHRSLKRQLDPQGIFNPGRMYADF